MSNQTPIKPGYKTTEFWLSLLAIIASSILPFIQDMPELYRFLGIVVSVLAALGYTASRTSYKNSRDI